MKVWLDDIRQPWKWGRAGWTWAKTYDEAITFLKNYDVEEIDLDHDLTIDQTLGILDQEKTGYDVLLWIEEKVVTDADYVPPTMYVHTANPAARPRMIAAIVKIKELATERMNKDG